MRSVCIVMVLLTACQAERAATTSGEDQAREIEPIDLRSALDQKTSVDLGTLGDPNDLGNADLPTSDGALPTSGDLIAPSVGDLATLPFAPDGGLILSFADAVRSDIYIATGNIDSQGAEVVVGNFTSDNKLDAVVTLPGENKLAMMRGDNTGKLAITLLAVDKRPNSPVAGDFNEDGVMDVAVACKDSNKIDLFAGGSTGLSALTSLTASQPLGLAVADLDHDGHLDLVAGDGGIYPADRLISIFYGHGNGTFDSAVTLTIAYSTYRLAIADFNHDGAPDLLLLGREIVNGWDDGFWVLNGDGKRHFTAGDKQVTNQGPRDVVVADFNHDGLLDVVIAHANTSHVSFSRGKGDGTFEAAIIENLDFDWLAVADYDLDGLLDVAMVSGGNQLGVYRNSGTGAFKYSASIYDGDPPGFVRAGDFNSDGKPDIISVDAFATNAYVSVLLNTSH